MENSISDVLIASDFSFCHYYRTMDGHTYGTLLPFSREKVLHNDGSMGVALLQIMSSCFSGKINWEYFKVVNIDVTIATEF